MIRLLRSIGGFYTAAAILLGFVLVAGASFLPGPDVGAETSGQIPPDRVVAVLSAGADYPPELRQALQALRERPDDPALAAVAARRIVSEGRARGDSRLVGAALGILRPFLDAASPEMLHIAADARQYQHDFAGALQLLDRALGLAPRDANLLLMRATIHTVRGDYVPAREDCARITALGLDEVGLLCTATTHVLTRDGPVWKARLAEMVDRPDLLAESLHPWALGLMAEIARHQGDIEEARQLLHRLLALSPGAVREKLILADILLATGEGPAVITLLADAPPIDGVLVRRVMALRLTGNLEALSLQRSLDQRFRLNIELGLDAHAREETMFFLYVAPERGLALQRAQANWSQQHEAEDLALLLEAARQAGDAGSAVAAQDWMSRADVTPPPVLRPAPFPAVR